MRAAKHRQFVDKLARPSARRLLREPRDSANDPAAIAEYIAEMSGELARLAGAARLDTLTYFLNMARMEAESHGSRRL
ncbi:MAG: hypothetical protein WAM55_06565 [Methylovirgula sp.]